MFRIAVVAAAAGAVIVGAGSTALAVSGGTQSSPGQPSAASGQQHSGKQAGRGKQLRRALRHIAHGEFVTTDRTGAFVHHDAIVGQVTAVSATSINVKAADGYAKTFLVNGSTHVRKRVAGAGQGKGAPAKIADVRSGDQVAVYGTEPATAGANPNAVIIVDGLKKR